MMRRHVLLAILLLAAAVPAAAQDSVPARRVALPWIAWGLPEDSVIALLGPPTNRFQEQSFDYLEYVDGGGGRLVARFVVLLPELGSSIAGVDLRFADDECVILLEVARADVERALPRLRWEGTPPQPADCAQPQRREWMEGLDAASGTRVSIRLDFDLMELSTDVTSRQALDFMGVSP